MAIKPKECYPNVTVDENNVITINGVKFNIGDTVYYCSGVQFNDSTLDILLNNKPFEIYVKEAKIIYNEKYEAKLCFEFNLGNIISQHRLWGFFSENEKVFKSKNEAIKYGISKSYKEFESYYESYYETKINKLKKSWDFKKGVLNNLMNEYNME